jgi:hypothetical protein
MPIIGIYPGTATSAFTNETTYLDPISAGRRWTTESGTTMAKGEAIECFVSDLEQFG